ncbi:hypothetical protein AAG906_035491 [Vitis piasezkii]
MASSSSTTSNHSIDPTTVVPSLSNLPFTISVKLNSSNYPIWKTQALPYFRGQAVFGYLDGTIPTPPQEIDAPHPSTAIQIRTQLANARKGALSANAYFLSIKRMADELAGQPLKPDDIITYVLARLGQEYDSLASTITSRSDPVTLEEFYSLLLICESRIHHNNQSLHVTASVKHCHQATSAAKPIHFSHDYKFSTISPWSR